MSIARASNEAKGRPLIVRLDKVTGNARACLASPPPVASLPAARSTLRPSASARERSITEGSTPVSRIIKSGTPFTFTCSPIEPREKSNGTQSGSAAAALRKNPIASAAPVIRTAMPVLMDIVFENTITGDRYVWLMNGTTFWLFIGKWGHGARNGLPCPR
jgi:hypothetical protein